MNSRERLLACLRGEQPDRVPISTYELVGWNRQGWENRQPSYRGLMEFIRAQTDCMYMCSVPVANLRENEHDTTVETYEQDGWQITRTVIRTSTGKLTKVTRQNAAVNTIWTLEHPVKNLTDLQSYMELAWEAGEPDFSQLAQAERDLEDQRGLPLVSFADPICELAEAFEFGAFMIHSLEHPEAITAALEQLHKRRMEELKRILAGPVKNVIFRIVGPEYATAPYLSPGQFREFVTRYDQTYIRMIQEAGAFVRIHSHGKIAGVLDQIVEMAPDALDPIEPPPDGDIELGAVKEATGGAICLMGGIELKHLEHKNEEFIEELVRQTVSAGKKGGGFVIMPTAAPINVDLSPQTKRNYYRFIETALETGKY